MAGPLPGEAEGGGGLVAGGRRAGGGGWRVGGGGWVGGEGGLHPHLSFAVFGCLLIKLANNRIEKSSNNK